MWLENANKGTAKQSIPLVENAYKELRKIPNPIAQAK